MQTSDDNLLRLALGNTTDKSNAIGELFDRYSVKFTGYLIAKGVPEDRAYDVVQETFMRLLRSNHDLAALKSASGYLWSVLKRTEIDVYRASLKHSTTTELDTESLTGPDAPVAHAGNVENSIEGLHCAARALQALRHQSEEKADAIYLKTLEGWSIRDLAEYLERSEGATKVFVHTARKAYEAVLRTMCPDYFDQSSD